MRDGRRYYIRKQAVAAIHLLLFCTRRARTLPHAPYVIFLTASRNRRRHTHTHTRTQVVMSAAVAWPQTKLWCGAHLDSRPTRRVTYFCVCVCVCVCNLVTGVCNRQQCTASLYAERAGAGEIVWTAEICSFPSPMSFLPLVPRLTAGQRRRSFGDGG